MPAPWRLLSGWPRGVSRYNPSPEGCESGRIGWSRKPLCLRAPWVQIPLPPPSGGNRLGSALQRLRAEGRPDNGKCSRRKVWRMAIAILLGVLLLVGAGLVIALKIAAAAPRELGNLEGEFAEARGGLALDSDSDPAPWSSVDLEILRDDVIVVEGVDPFDTLTDMISPAAWQAAQESNGSDHAAEAWDDSDEADDLEHAAASWLAARDSNGSEYTAASWLASQESNGSQHTSSTD